MKEKMFIVTENEKILLTKDKKLIKEVGDYKKFLDYLEEEIFKLHNAGYSDLGISKKLRITEESVKFLIEKERERREAMSKILSGLFSFSNEMEKLKV